MMLAPMHCLPFEGNWYLFAEPIAGWHSSWKPAVVELVVAAAVEPELAPAAAAVVPDAEPAVVAAAAVVTTAVTVVAAAAAVAPAHCWPWPLVSVY